MSQILASIPPAKTRRWGRWMGAALVVLLGVGIWQRETLWVRYCSERLERASDDGRAAWAEKLAANGEAAVPAVLSLFRRDDPGVCAAGRSAAEQLMAGWGADDPRRKAFAIRFAAEEPRFSTPGRAAALDLLPALIATKAPGLAATAKAMIAAAAASESAAVRVQAVAAAMRPDMDVLDAIVPLLNDTAAEVRRAAVLALGPVRDGDRSPVVGDDDLLRLLHDADPEVRHLCELSLRGRGRSAHDIKLGRRYAAPSAAERQKLLIDLSDEDELDVTVWLERLTADADPAVRAGAARVAAERKASLYDRLEQMSRTDPDGTVRRIADYYSKKMLAAR